MINRIHFHHPAAHLSVHHTLATFTGRPRPAPIPFPLLSSVAGVPVGVLAPSLPRIALLVHRAVVVVMVVVVLAVFGAAAISVPISVAIPVLGWDVARLGSCAQVCP